jgi:hypothetical protein
MAKKALARGTLARACYLAIGAAGKPLAVDEVIAILRYVDFLGPPRKSRKQSKRSTENGEGYDYEFFTDSDRDSVRVTLWANRAFYHQKGSLVGGVYGLVEWGETPPYYRSTEGRGVPRLHAYREIKACAFCGQPEDADCHRWVRSEFEEVK